MKLTSGKAPKCSCGHSDRGRYKSKANITLHSWKRREAYLQQLTDERLVCPGQVTIAGSTPKQIIMQTATHTGHFRVFMRFLDPGKDLDTWRKPMRGELMDNWANCFKILALPSGARRMKVGTPQMQARRWKHVGNVNNKVHCKQIFLHRWGIQGENWENTRLDSMWTHKRRGTKIRQITTETLSKWATQGRCDN